jgi:hypothetical protein
MVCFVMLTIEPKVLVSVGEHRSRRVPASFSEEVVNDYTQIRSLKL